MLNLIFKTNHNIHLNLESNNRILKGSRVSKNIFLTFILFTISSLAVAQAPAGFKPVGDEKALKTKLDAVSKTVTTIRSDFTQEKKLSVMSKKITSKGKFLFKKENKLRLEYVEPFAYLMVVNKDKIYIKDEGKVSTYDARSNKLFRQINTMILASIQGMGNTKDFQSTYFESDKQYLLIMKPLTKSVSEMIKSLEIYLDKKDCSVVKFDMVEPSGDYTSIQLTTKEINVPVTDDNFVLK